MSDPDCLFCKIAAGDLGTEFVYEDEHIVAFHDVSLRFNPEAQSFEARLLRDDKPGPRRASGRFAISPPHVITAVTLPHPTPANTGD